MKRKFGPAMIVPPKSTLCVPYISSVRGMWVSSKRHTRLKHSLRSFAGSLSEPGQINSAQINCYRLPNIEGTKNKQNDNLFKNPTDRFRWSIFIISRIIRQQLQSSHFPARTFRINVSKGSSSVDGKPEHPGWPRGYWLLRMRIWGCLYSAF